MLLISTIQLLLGLKSDRPIFFDFIFFLTGLVFAALIIVLIIDYVSTSYDVVHGKIVYTQLQIIHVNSEETNAIKRYKISDPEVLQSLRVNQRVKLHLTKLTRLPRSIHILENSE